MKQHKVLIIGGGASGLAAAIVSARKGNQVTLLERGDRVGKKLLATGNGRCNLANLGAPRYFGDPEFAGAVLRHMPVEGVLDFFREIGLPTRPDGAGRVYPGCNQAAAVLDVLRSQLDALGVRVITGAEVRELKPGWQAVTSQGIYTADSVVVCCGGLAAPKLGAVNAYSLLTGLGCRLIPPAPALAPLETEKAPVKGLSGLRLPAVLTLCGREPVAAAMGEALFADYGVSGVCAMQLARDAQNLLRRGQKATLYMDFSPTLGLTEYRMDRVEPQAPGHNEGQVRQWLHDRETLPGGDPLLGALPRLLREKLQKAPPRDLPRLLCAYPLPLTGVRGFDQAQVTQGGIDCRDFDPATLAHRTLPGLYACGEILNVDGDCGGYNLQFAFATGLLAGRDA
ncbi:MAG: aminoacetone oxidase family FAD-binding enzyme [Clostridia bacterium]|nr:aminoacetone oxidase family FAD-binding enzyme [Clostridia bacterium]